MNAKKYLESQGVYSLDTKKRTQEVIEWMESYAEQKLKERDEKTLLEFAGYLFIKCPEISERFNTVLAEYLNQHQ